MDFKVKMKDLKEKSIKNSEKIDENLLEFLMNWLTNHILGTDMRFTDSLKKNMVF